MTTLSFPGPYFLVSNVTTLGSPRRQRLVAVTSTLSPDAGPTVMDPFRLRTRIHLPAGILPDHVKVLSLWAAAGLPRVASSSRLQAASCRRRRSGFAARGVSGVI